MSIVVASLDCALQCFGTVGWSSGEYPACKNEWRGVGVVISLEQGADCLRMVQLMPLPSQNPIVSCLI